jgi:acetoin utilization protein AcuC
VLNVVPRAWTHLLAIVSGEPIEPDTPVPDGWRAEVGEAATLTMSDGAPATFRPFEEGFTPGSRVDQAILATRKAVFPELGLDPSL